MAERIFDIDLANLLISPVSKAKPWPLYDSGISAYQADFDPVLEGVDLRQFIKQKSDPIVVDLMSSSAALRDLAVGSGIELGKGIAVSYEDLRSRQRIIEDRLCYNIVQVKGDLNDFKTWGKIQSELGDDKADVILQRGWAGFLANISANKGFYNKSRRHLWAALSEDNGLFVSQVHDDESLKAAGIDMENWVMRLNDLGVSALYEPGVPVVKMSFADQCYGLVKLIRTPNSPKVLPVF